MYSKPSVLGATATVGGLGGATMLPETGMSLAVQIAIAAIVALAVWALAYGVNAKLTSR